MEIHPLGSALIASRHRLDHCHFAITTFKCVALKVLGGHGSFMMASKPNQSCSAVIAWLVGARVFTKEKRYDVI